MATRASRRNPIGRFPSSELEDKFELFCNRPVALERQLDLVSLGNHEVVGWLKTEVWPSGHEKIGKCLSPMRSHVLTSQRPNIPNIEATGGFAQLFTSRLQS